MFRWQKWEADQEEDEDRRKMVWVTIRLPPLLLILVTSESCVGGHTFRGTPVSARNDVNERKVNTARTEGYQRSKGRFAQNESGKVRSKNLKKTTKEYQLKSLSRSRARVSSLCQNESCQSNTRKVDKEKWTN